MCGEYIENLLTFAWQQGSPPHVWRILLKRARRQQMEKITSTCVENTVNGKRLDSKSRDHLHMCGEYPFLSSPSKMIGGSPPHTWRILRDW